MELARSRPPCALKPHQCSAVGVSEHGKIPAVFRLQLNRAAVQHEQARRCCSSSLADLTPQRRQGGVWCEPEQATGCRSSSLIASTSQQSKGGS